MLKKLYDNIDGKDVYLYTVRNKNIEADICEVGARLNALRINGVDIVLGFNTVSDYIKSRTHAGATIGRVANRIADGKFVLNGRTYELNKNDGANHLHGGNSGFDEKLFNVVEQTENAITMQYISADGEEGYPGTLEFTVIFAIKDNSLNIEFIGKSDKDTLWCPTNHAYFNLDGEVGGDCRDNLLQINADRYTPVRDGLIPTGEKRSVGGTPFDFTELKRIGRDFDSDELQSTKGYDHNYILNGEHAAHAESTNTGLQMDVYTDMPCMQFYTGGKIYNAIGKSRIYDSWAGFCMEPQFCPNAINSEGFVKPILRAGEIKKHYIKLKFDKH